MGLGAPASTRQATRCCRRLQKGCMRHSTPPIVGRIGGDEFVVFIKDVESAENIIESAEKLRSVSSRTQPFKAALSCFMIIWIPYVSSHVLPE